MQGEWGGGRQITAPHRQETRMKELHKRCKVCGERFTVIRLERERTSAYCEVCRTERQRAQTRARMQALRARQRTWSHDAGVTTQASITFIAGKVARRDASVGSAPRSFPGG